MSEPNHRVSIVTDSISSLTQEQGREFGVHVVPIHISFGTDGYRDGIDLHAERFYSMLNGTKQMPTTSQPTAADFAECYARLEGEAGSVVSIHASKKVSATVDSARAACAEFPNLPIHVIDCETLSLGQGLIVIAAARAAAAGKSAGEIVQLVEGLIPRTRVLFTVETLEYLRRGGRIGGATALLGSALRIKPILHIADGRVEPLEKARTSKRAVARLLDLMAEEVETSDGVHAAVLHCNASDAAQSLAQEIATRFQCVELHTAEAGPTIGAHGGPGTLGVTFYAD
jgi:DegV family protein with EDD domain